MFPHKKTISEKKESADLSKKESLAALSIGAIGIVYGDIGTSPLYAMNEVFFGNGNLPQTPEHIAGTASLIFWILLIVVSVKYAALVLRADRDGEGGVFSLFGLIEHLKGRYISFTILLLMFAAGLLFGEGIITPAISVLSAVEGLKVAFPGVEGLIVPLTLIILTAIFIFQKKGTRIIGRIYSPVMLLWFFAIGALGTIQLANTPEILLSIIDPRSALTLLFSLHAHELALLVGAVFLAITGSEALYADLGHFGKKAIRVGWFSIVLPALLLSYAGQAAYLASGAHVSHGNIFYSLVPEAFLVPMIILATVATSIASVSLIFGAYSLVSQAMAINLLPRLRVVHTNKRTEGQIYIPAVNWALYIGSVSLVLFFGSATNLAAAYGFAVSGVMLVTSIAMYAVSRHEWGWSRLLALSTFGLFAVIDSGFVIANSVKFMKGGYIPLLLGCVIFSIILTWRWGRKLLRLAYIGYVSGRDMKWFLDLKRRIKSEGGVLRDERVRHLVEIDRAVVFLISYPIKDLSSTIPVKVRVYLKRTGAIPKNIILLNIEQRHIPFVRDHYRITDLGQSVYAIRATFGFMEDPDAGRVLRDLYAMDVFDKKFRRCTIEASEDEFIIDHDLPPMRLFFTRFFRFLLSMSVPRYRYFGLTGMASAGLSKTTVPVHFSSRGVRVELPEFPLVKEGDPIDPDTLEPSTILYEEVWQHTRNGGRRNSTMQ